MTEQSMSFTARAKEEIFSGKPLKGPKWRSFACGLFLLGSKADDAGISMATEYKVVSMCYSEAFRMLTGGKLSYSRGTGGGGNAIYRSRCDDAGLVASILRLIEIDADAPLGAAHMLGNEARLAFLSGAFMACSSVTNPSKGYHLSFKPACESAGDCLFELLCEMGYPPKTTTYRGEQLLYYKESEAIEDILTAAGAPACSLELMEVKVYRDVRNKANRLTNAETANIDRTAASAAVQISSIKYIYEQGQTEMLPPELYEMAQLRLSYPEASLRELGSMFAEPISRSGVNHRMRRLTDWANALRQKLEKDN